MENRECHLEEETITYRQQIGTTQIIHDHKMDNVNIHMHLLLQSHLKHTGTYTHMVA